MRHGISLNGSFFNTQRMVPQYVLKAYLEYLLCFLRSLLFKLRRQSLSSTRVGTIG
jgi:hypothetical protein